MLKRRKVLFVKTLDFDLVNVPVYADVAHLMAGNREFTFTIQTPQLLSVAPPSPSPLPPPSPPPFSNKFLLQNHVI